MKKFIIIIFALNSSTLWAAKECHIKYANNLCAEISFVSGISRKEDSKFKVVFHKMDTAKVNFNITKFDLKLWMVMKSGHEHGSESPQQSESSEDLLDP